MRRTAREKVGSICTAAAAGLVLSLLLPWFAVLALAAGCAAAVIYTRM